MKELDETLIACYKKEIQNKEWLLETKEYWKRYRIGKGDAKTHYHRRFIRERIEVLKKKLRDMEARKL